MAENANDAAVGAGSVTTGGSSEDIDEDSDVGAGSRREKRKIEQQEKPDATRQKTALPEQSGNAAAAQMQMEMATVAATDIKFCGVDDPTCESCQ